MSMCELAFDLNTKCKVFLSEQKDLSPNVISEQQTFYFNKSILKRDSGLEAIKLVIGT